MFRTFMLTSQFDRLHEHFSNSLNTRTLMMWPWFSKMKRVKKNEKNKKSSDFCWKKWILLTSFLVRLLNVNIFFLLILVRVNFRAIRRNLRSFKSILDPFDYVRWFEWNHSRSNHQNATNANEFHHFRTSQRNACSSW